jgi:fumarate reductase flavoprotein subunit
MKRFSSIAAALIAVATFAVPAFADKQMETDLVVVGAGTSGLASAVQATQGGAKVIVLEKQAKAGGTGLFCEGIFAAESKVQKRIGISITKEQAYKTIMDYSHWLANGSLAKAIVDKAPETIDWLDELGVKIEYVGPGGPGGPLTWHVMAPGPDYPHKNPRDFHCERMINVFKKFVTDKGGKILLETPGTNLITENGKVVGVVAKNKSGEVIKIKAKAVVVATGGFANNKEMMKKYAPYPDVIPVGQIGKDGDGIKMAWAAGAAEEGVTVMQNYRPGLAGFHPASQLIGMAVQPYFFVDPKGERYTDESNIVLWPYSGNALQKIGGTAYSIFDDATRKFNVEKGIELQLGEWIKQGVKLTKFDEEFAKELSRNRGNVFKANTIEELAKQLGMNPEVLKESIEKNNTYAANREDGQFFKNPKFLRPIASAPFYAVKLHPRHLGTLGGVKINAKIEALDKDGNAIPGLYVAGTDAGGMYGDSYDLLLGGGTVAFAVNSGRIAAENALKYSGISK